MNILTVTMMIFRRAQESGSRGDCWQLQRGCPLSLFNMPFFHSPWLSQNDKKRCPSIKLKMVSWLNFFPPALLLRQILCHLMEILEEENWFFKSNNLSKFYGFCLLPAEKDQIPESPWPSLGLQLYKKFYPIFRLHQSNAWAVEHVRWDHPFRTEVRAKT